jgi:DNA-binding response OmpR family regulator/HD-like signal output (HDOD) protein
VRVIVVDDDPMVGRSLGRMLKAFGCPFEVHTHPSTALRRLLVAPFDVALVDLMMPGVDGLQFIREVGALESKVPIILMSGRARPRDIVEAHRLGAVDCLLKPFDAAELEAALARAVYHDVDVSAPAPAAAAPTPPTPVPTPPGGSLGSPTPTAAESPTEVPALALATGSAATDLAARVLERVHQMPFALPVPPALLSRMAHLDQSDTATEEEVIAVIDSSAVLSAEVMRAGRAADISRASAPPRTLTEAIMRLGTSRALRHAQTAAHLSVSQTLLRTHPELVGTLWVHHLMSARAAEFLARALCPQVAPGLHGLSSLMELGELFVLRVLADLEPEWLLPGANPQPVRALTSAVHAEAGRIALARLDMPRVYGEVALAHTRPVVTKGPLSPAASTLLVLRAGRTLAGQLTPGCPQSAPHSLTAAERAALPGLDATLIQQAARFALDEVKGTLGLNAGAG